jgi:proteasome lid subunit RPN8/RPN11
MIEIPSTILDAIESYLIKQYPLEGCGLISADISFDKLDTVVGWFPCKNKAKSAKLYELDPVDYLKADRAAEDKLQQIIGVVHSHTHSDPYPSPTDVNNAPDPSWHYVIVSLRFPSPSTRSYKILDGKINEEKIVIT